MQTNELVSQIKEEIAPGVSRTKILAYIKRAQQELFQNDCAQTAFLNQDDVDFPVPILSTTAGTLDYIPSASNLVDSEGNAISLTVGGYSVTIRKIKHVFINVSELAVNYDNLFIGREFDWAGINNNWSQKIYNVRYQKVPTTLYDKNDAEGAKLIFAEDPGTYSDKYYIEFYINPIDLTSESIPLTIDSDKWQEAIMDAVQGYMEFSRNGRSDMLDRFHGYWMRKFKGTYNSNMEEREPIAFGTRVAL